MENEIVNVAADLERLKIKSMLTYHTMLDFKSYEYKSMRRYSQISIKSDYSLVSIPSLQGTRRVHLT
jgi:hypothetical protein